MAKKAAITLIALYLLGVIGVTIDALSANWNDEWPIQQQLVQAGLAGASWPISVIELFRSDALRG